MEEIARNTVKLEHLKGNRSDVCDCPGYRCAKEVIESIGSWGTDTGVAKMPRGEKDFVFSEDESGKRVNMMTLVKADIGKTIVFKARTT